MGKAMKKIGICVLAACVALGTGACGTIGPIIGNLQNSPGKDTEKETNSGDYLIEVISDISVGPESETEAGIIIPDEEIIFDMTEESAQILQQTAESETEGEGAAAETGMPAGMQADSETQAGAEERPGMETEMETKKETETETEQSYGPLERPLKELIAPREAAGENWAVAYEDLATGQKYGHREEETLQSASVVKLFIMGAVYRYMCYPPEGEEAIVFGESYDGQLRDTIVSMITVSDNACANLLIERLGGGDFSLGAERIKVFCAENGYEGTSIGRRFMDSNPTGDNYTTAADTRKFLSDLYHGTLVNEEASAKMLDIVKGQTRKNKIPAGLPAGFTSGNKTGEMPEGYGFGCIENDSAIVFPPEGMGDGYVLTVMSTNLAGRNSEAISVITQISSMVAQWYIAQHEQQSTEPNG